MYQPIHGENSGQPQVIANKSRAIFSQETSFTQTTERSHPLPGSRIKEPHVLGTQGKKRLSQWIKFNFHISLLAFVGAVAFISWLWWAPREDVQWREWVLALNRLSLAITLAAVVIRVAIGVLASLDTAMTASAAVERRGVQLHAIA